MVNKTKGHPRFRHIIVIILLPILLAIILYYSPRKYLEMIENINPEIYIVFYQSNVALLGFILATLGIVYSRDKSTNYFDKYAIWFFYDILFILSNIFLSLFLYIFEFNYSIHPISIIVTNIMAVLILVGLLLKLIFVNRF